MTRSIVLKGKCSWFGGPHDDGVAPHEGLAIFNTSKGAPEGLFLDVARTNSLGTARRLNPNAHYIAVRWNYHVTSVAYLQGITVTVKNARTGKQFTDVHPADWGPNVRTGRVADLSPGLLKDLDLNTDDYVEVTIPLP